MQLIMLTHNSVKNYFDSMVLDDVSNVFDFDTKRVVNYVIADLTTVVGTEPSNPLSHYLTFIYMMLKVHSATYVKATSPNSAVSADHLLNLLSKLSKVAPGITPDDILVADKMDILYGSQHFTHSEHTKFSVWFYEHVYDICINTVDPERADDVYTEVVNYFETVISNIEQNIIFLGQEINPDDVVVICIYPINGALFFLID